LRSSGEVDNHAAQVNYGNQTVPITEFSRPVVRAKLRMDNGEDMMVFVAHLKSKRPMIEDDEDRNDPLAEAMGKARSLIRRAAEAIALRHSIVDVMRETQMPVVVLGDMNDSVTAVTSDILAGSQPWRFLPFERKKAVWDVLLYNVKDIQAKRAYHDVYYTHIYNGHYEALDHIYVSEEFVYENRDRIGAVKAVRVYNDHLADDSLGGEDIEKWQSDHGQVVAEIALEKPEEV
ncbi:MAG: endonuclease/exonuclease/phosphatase family protein, partial [Chloroflexota bacterium]